ncbi:hypothetical protein [Acinetobacter soli]|uniref:hypothetical protein n=1 Tax=Acinetobacter soli TaxID=487316 RepID=UPI0012507345|nr:hypothetical protein [Acinetobacter soli]
MLKRSLFFVLILNLLFVPITKAFDVFGFIPWKMEKDQKTISDKEEITQILSSYGIRKIDVIYHNRMLTNNNVDIEKIEKLALSSKNVNYPISFDLEIGNRNKPETVLPTLFSILDIYKANGGNENIGVYSILPQSSVGGINLTSEKKLHLMNLNKKYEILASRINFLSPVFYFNDGENLDYWKKAVDFNMEQSLKIAKKYNLKIYPYITNAFRYNENNKKLTYIKTLTEEQMFDVLNYIKNKGADGVIIWAGSGTPYENGELPKIKLSSPWFKGVVRFINQK